MTTSLEFIAECLDRRGWHYCRDTEKSRILTGAVTQHANNLPIVIHLSEDQEFLHLYTPELFHVKDHVYKGVLFQTLLSICWESKMLRYEYDPTDGEIRASIELPLEDAILTERQFNRCLSALIQLVDDKSMSRLQSVLARGEDPGQQTLAERLLDQFSKSEFTLLQEIVQLGQQRQEQSEA